MQKKRTGKPVPKRLLPKLWKIMRLSVFISLLFVSQTFATATYSQQTRLTLKMEKAKVIDVLTKIEDESEFFFLFNQKLLDVERQVNVDAKNESIANILSGIFENTNVTFLVKDRQIILTTDNAPRVSDPVIKKSISGKVTDSSGATVPGVSVVVKGSTTGIITDNNGSYSLSNVPENATLQFSFVGMKTQEIKIGSQTTINVVLADETVGIEEVVAIGYGTQKKSDVTGSVASVKGDAIAKRGTINTTQALQGLVSGVTVVNNSGRPGAGATVLIRGQGSYGDIDPLYIVDGAITDNIGFIDPNDIASLEILKDASSASIYGSRAANGVVIVTTKRGKSGMSKVSFSSNFGVQNIAHGLDFATSQQWRDKEVWKYQNEGKTIPVNLQDGKFDPSISTNWQDVLFRNASQQNYNLSFSGGGLNNNFNFSMGYANQEGIQVGSGYERINIRMNSDYIAGKFKFGESLSINRSNYPGGTITTSFYGWPFPVFAPKDKDGNYQTISNGYGLDLSPNLYEGNMLAYIEIPERKSSNMNIVANVYGQLSFAEGLFIKTSGNVQWINSHNKTYTPTYIIGHLSNPIADLTERRSELYTLLLENTLNFKRAFGEHNVDAVIGWSRQLELTNRINLAAEGFPDGILQGDAAETILPQSGGSEVSSSLESYLGRVNYSYKNRYQLTASIRQDASSRLIKSLRTGRFPSFSLGWVASEEPFFPKNSFITRLKFRGGYGELGRLNSVGEYQTQNTLAIGGDNIDYILGSDQHFSNGVTIASMTNSLILWERAKSTNIAMESSMLNGKIFINAEYFIKNTKDLQFSAPIPNTVGTNISSILVNAGDIQNKGFELTLGYRKNQGDFTFDASVNLYQLKNKVLAFNNPGDTFIGGGYGYAGQNAIKAEVGREMSNFWLLRTDGIFQSKAEIDAYNKNGVLIQPNAKPGDLRFKDINEDGKITVADKQYISGSIPDLEYGINFNGAYKNFDLGILLQGVAGAKLFNGVGRTMSGILADQSTDYWRVDNPDAKFFRPSLSDPNANMGENDFYLENSSYLRLKNIQLGCTLPAKVLSVLKIKSVRLNITGQNLLTLTSFSGFDPENVSFGLSRGVNTNVYPLAKTILFGLAVEF
jgi:TonB-linked SusC/RagA family outer membrane protein